jgi:chaperonin cofactor prefoldin
MVIRWKTTSADLLKKLEPKMTKVKEEIERIERTGGHTFVFRKLYGEAEFNYNLAKNGKAVHNLEYTEELLEFANRRLDDAMKQIDQRRGAVAQGRM